MHSGTDLGFLDFRVSPLSYTSSKVALILLRQYFLTLPKMKLSDDYAFEYIILWVSFLIKSLQTINREKLMTGALDSLE